MKPPWGGDTGAGRLVLAFLTGVTVALVIVRSEPLPVFAEEWVRYRDSRSEISISYPRSWQLVSYREKDCVPENTDRVGVAIARGRMSFFRSDEGTCNPQLIGPTRKGWVWVTIHHEIGGRPRDRGPEAVFPISVEDFREAYLRDAPYEAYGLEMTIDGDRWYVGASWHVGATPADISTAERIIESISIG